MTRRPAVVSAEMPLGGALDVMGERGISSVLVTGPTRAPYGILTLRDLVAKVVRHGLDPATLRAGDIATWRLITADASWTVQDAASAMAAAGIRRLPVVQRGELLGVISDTDLFIALVPDENWEHARAVRKARAAQRARPESGAAMVGDLMSAPALTVDPSVTVQRAVEKMVAVGVSSLLAATGTEGHPAGIVTKRDVVTKLLAQGRHPSDLRVDEIMSAPVRTIESGASLEACSTRMAEERLRRFPVTIGGQIVGIISDSDILAALVGHQWRGRRSLRVPAAAIVADVMRLGAGPLIPAGLPTLAPEASIWDAAERLAKAGTKELPVAQGGQLIGTVHEADIVQALEERGAPD